MDSESGDVFGPPDITQYDSEGPPDITQYDSEGPPDITQYGDSSSGSGAGKSKDADWASIFNTGIKTAGDVVTKTVDATTKKNTSLPNQPATPANTLPVTPGPSSSPPNAQPVAIQPLAGSPAKTVAIVGGVIVGGGLLLGIGVALSSSSKSSRRGGF